MYYSPIHFEEEEIFPPEIISIHMNSGYIANSIWRLMDFRVLWTADRLREKFGVMVVNDYLWGGSNKYRGYRPFAAIFDEGHFRITGEVRAEWSSFTSQHCAGRALDSKFKEISAEDIRQNIKVYPEDPAFKYITAIEDNVDWFHFDVRCWDVETNGIFFLTRSL